MGVRYIWYDKLYYGEKAAKHKLLSKIKLSTGWEGFDTYLLTIPDGNENMLDIIKSIEFHQPAYDGYSKYVVGVAKGREEAIELVKTIIEEALSSTGKADIKNYLRFGPSFEEVT